MKEIVIGIIAGIVGGMGMGGGTVLILLLSLISNIEQHVAQATNVIFFVPTAISAIVIFIKNKNIKFKVGVPICLWGLLGAYIGATISSKMEVGVLRKCFGIFLIFIAIYQMYALFVKRINFSNKKYINEKNRNNSTKD